MSHLTVDYTDVVTSNQPTSGIGTQKYPAVYRGQCVWTSGTVAVLWEFFQTGALPGHWRIEGMAGGMALLTLEVAFSPIAAPTVFTPTLHYLTDSWDGRGPTRFTFDHATNAPPDLIFPLVIPVYP